MNYTLDYFINKFEGTSEDDWCEFDYEQDGKHCALGLCGMTEKDVLVNERLPEAYALVKILNCNVAKLSDGYIKEYQQPTPRQRVLAKLYDKKAEQAVKEAEQIIKEYETVPA